MAHNPGPRTGSLGSFEGEIVEVSPDGYTVVVKTRNGMRVSAQMSSELSTIGADTDEGLFGAGFKVSAVVGSMVLLETSSFGQHYVKKFLYPYTSNGYQGNREAIRSGDIKLNTRAGSFVEVQASGLAQVGATDISKTTYLPDDESIRNICKNWLISSGLGDMAWTFDDDTRQGSFNLTSRSGSDAASPGGSLSLGDNKGGNLVELRSTNGKDASMAIDSKGNLRTDSSKDITSKATGVIRQDGRKIYLNSGASKSASSFGGNFKQVLPKLPVSPGVPTLPGGLAPGVPSAITRFPVLAQLPTSLPAPDTKRLLSQAKTFIPPNPLPAVPPDPFNPGSAGDGGSGRPA